MSSLRKKVKISYFLLDLDSLTPFNFSEIYNQAREKLNFYRDNLILDLKNHVNENEFFSLHLIIIQLEGDPFSDSLIRKITLSFNHSFTKLLNQVNKSLFTFLHKSVDKNNVVIEAANNLNEFYGKILDAERYTLSLINEKNRLLLKETINKANNLICEHFANHLKKVDSLVNYNRYYDAFNQLDAITVLYDIFTFLMSFEFKTIINNTWERFRDSIDERIHYFEQEKYNNYFCSKPINFFNDLNEIQYYNQYKILEKIIKQNYLKEFDFLHNINSNEKEEILFKLKKSLNYVPNEISSEIIHLYYNE